MPDPLPDPAAAAGRIAGHIRHTPVLRANARLAFKLEQHQVSGSFKARGACNAILSAREQGRLPASGVVAASGGNHGIAVATAASTLGASARVFVPETAAPAKVDLLRDTGAEVTVTGTLYAQAQEAATELAERTGALRVHPYDQLEVIEGQSTLGLELAEFAEFDTVLLAVGGGGLLGGVIAGLAGTGKRVVAVEPERIPTMHTALAEGGPVTVEASGVALDSLGASKVGELAYTLASSSGVDSVLVSEEEIIAGRTALWREFRIAAEYSAATAYAALRCGAYRPADGERVLVVICGANLDPGMS